MNKKSLLSTLVVLMLCSDYSGGASHEANVAVPSPVVKQTLVHQVSLEYLGAFRVPRGNLGGDSKKWSMGRGGRGITYNQKNNSLIMSGSFHEKLAIEISIPEPLISTDIVDLNTAALVQAPGRVTDGQWDYLNLDGTAIVNGGAVGGFLVYKGKLIGNAYPYYASGDEGHLTHFTSSLNWSSEGSQFSGWKRVGINPTNSASSSTGWVGGYMGLIPPEWQDRLGWPALTGNGAIAIVSRSSFGPSVSGFNPDDIGVIETAPTELFFGYPSDHQTLGGYSGTAGTLLYNSSTQFAGVVFPHKTDSILIFGKHGLGYNGAGEGCYGSGTADKSLHGTPDGQGNIYCYDPVNSDKGGHAYPYVSQIWAYDANDILEVKNGTKKYWEVVPYERIELKLPFTDELSSLTGTKVLGGVAYDPSSQRIFVSQLLADHWADEYEPNPIIHVYKVVLDQDRSK